MKKIILESDVLKLIKNGNKILFVDKETIITPLALDKIKEKKIEIRILNETQKTKDSLPEHFEIKKIVLGSDHTGYKIKNVIKDYLISKGYEIEDVGCFDENSCDYPDFALAAALKVKKKNADVAIFFDATGIPSAMTANKISQIRAAVCYNEFSARSCRSHNNSNFLSLGAKTLGEETIKSIIEVFLSTKFDGGRHQRRLDKIKDIEERKL